MTKRTLWSAALFSFALAVPAMAQQPPPPDPAATVASRYQVAAQAQQDLAEAIRGLLIDRQSLEKQKAALEKHSADMDAYLKACGDKAGCTVPAPLSPVAKAR